MISTLRVSKIYLKSEENPKKKQRTVNGKLVHSPHGLGVSAESTTFALRVTKNNWCKQ